jgi:small subunit ribosomal protein S5
MDWSFNMAGREPRMPREEKQFDERVVAIDRVARVVKGGRRFRFRALVVVGDRKGKVGAGTAKGADVTAAVAKATEVAKKNLIQSPVEKGTIPHEQEAKVAGAHILIKPAAPGTGLIAGGVVRIVLEVAGVKDILSKSLGSSNKINLTYATLDALAQIQPRSKWLNQPEKKTTKAAPKKAAAKLAEVK